MDSQTFLTYTQRFSPSQCLSYFVQIIYGTGGATFLDCNGQPSSIQLTAGGGPDEAYFCALDGTVQTNGNVTLGSPGLCNPSETGNVIGSNNGTVFYSLPLYYSTTTSGVCAGTGGTGVYYINTNSWNTATKITSNSNGSTSAPTGYYATSLGFYRYWDGTTLGTEVTCSGTGGTSSNTYYNIALYYSDNLDVLCGNLAIENLFYIDTPSWDFASAIYTTDGITPAPAGYYTETPGLRRQWDGSILGPEVSCAVIDTGGGGCFIAGTEITLSDNTVKVIEDLKIGDQLASYNIEGLPLYSDDQNVLNTWNTSNIQGDYATTTVTNIQPFNTDKIININGLLQTTPNHRHLVKVEGIWSFIEAKDIKVGDILRNYNNEEVVVETVSEEVGNFTAYILDVEDIDLFYGNSILTHNVKDGTLL